MSILPLLWPKRRAITAIEKQLQDQICDLESQLDQATRSLWDTRKQLAYQRHLTNHYRLILNQLGVLKPNPAGTLPTVPTTHHSE